VDARPFGQRERFKRLEGALAKDGINMADHNRIIATTWRRMKSERG
jgi:hypothetical protein